MRLLNSNPEEVADLFSELSLESKALVDQIIEICWYMRGSVSYDQAWNLTTIERKQIIDLIEKNIKRTEETGLPLL